MRRWWMLAGVALLWLATSGAVEAQRGRSRSAVRVGVIADGPSEAFDRLHLLVRTEVIDLLGEQRQVTYPEEPTRAAWTPDSIRAVFEQAMADDEVDVVIALGVGLSVVVAETESLSKPVLLPVTVSPQTTGLPDDEGKSGRRNLNYLTGLNNYERDLARFAEIADLSDVVVFADRSTTELLPGLDAQFRATARDLGLGLELVRIDDSAESALAALPEGADAVYLTALPRFSEAELRRLIAGLNERRLPTFSALGPLLVEWGALATVTPQHDWTRRARRVALNLQRVLAGEDAGSLPTVFQPDEELVVNMATAREIGVYPSWQVISEARLVNQERDDLGEPMHIEDVVRLALAQNLDLSSGQRGVAAGAEEIAIARAPLLPTIDLDAGASYRDPDGATYFGEQEVNGRWSISATQVIFSESAWAGLVATEKQQQAREQEYETIVLDTTLSVVEAYLAVLRASTAERIERQNLVSVRSNLATAEVRRRIGVGRMEEVYRWQIEIASSRRAVINAIAARNQAEIELNRLLNRPLEERVHIADVDLPGVALWEDRRMRRYLDNPQGFDAFRDFMAQEAINNAPELRQLDASIRAQERVLEGQKRIFWAPTIAFTGSVSHIFLRAGVGTEDPMVPPDAGFGQQNDLDYRLGLTMSLPLFEGAGRFADVRRSQELLSQLSFDRGSVAQRVEQRVRAALHQAGASRPGYELATQAATAARQNLELVRDAYARGAVNIITVIDAQTQANRQALSAAGALYDFMTDYARAERASGRFVFQMNDADRRDIADRFLAFVAERQRGPLR